MRYTLYITIYQYIWLTYSLPNLPNIHTQQIQLISHSLLRLLTIFILSYQHFSSYFYNNNTNIYKLFLPAMKLRQVTVYIAHLPSCCLILSVMFFNCCWLFCIRDRSTVRWSIFSWMDSSSASCVVDSFDCRWRRCSCSLFTSSRLSLVKCRIYMSKIYLIFML